MVIDARSVSDRSEIECDVCIVGAGPAGITVARELETGGLRTCLLEGGGLKREEPTQALNEGESAGGRYRIGGYAPAHALGISRLRQLGGASNHWAGWCRPFDELDFEERSGVPDSGWPIDRAELMPYYRRAQDVCQLGPFEYSAPRWARSTRTTPLPLTEPLASAIYQISNRPRFAEVYGPGLRRSRSIRLVLHANAIGLGTNRDGSRVERVRVATLTGRRFDVRARRFVLATGGIENSRLLLASNDVRPRGLANDHDVVGRYFADHPHAVVANFAYPDDVGFDFYTVRKARGATLLGALVTTERFARSERLLRITATFQAPRAKTPLDAGVLELLRGANGDRARGRMGAMYVRSEMAPDRRNRVTLATQRDPFGFARARVDWRMRDLERRSIERSLEVTARAFGRSLGARVFSATAHDERAWSEFGGGNHHMGTTRMHRSPRHGVVDADCRVHGVPNLFVAGSSVFPTSGWANPTLTIVALALRLARTLRSEA